MTRIGVQRETPLLSCEEDAQGVRLGAQGRVIEILSDAERVGAAVQGPPGRSLDFDWEGARLGVGYEGDTLEYRDLGRAYGVGGWALWRDTRYTPDAPLELNGAATVQFTPEANLTYAPDDAALWFDGATFRPQNVGEAYALRLGLTALPLVAERELAVSLIIPGFFTVWGAQTELSRGAGVEQRLAFTGILYALETFVREGGMFTLETDGPLEIYDLSLMAVRLSE